VGIYNSLHTSILLQRRNASDDSSFEQEMIGLQCGQVIEKVLHEGTHAEPMHRRCQDEAIRRADVAQKLADEARRPGDMTKCKQFLLILQKMDEFRCGAGSRACLQRLIQQPGGSSCYNGRAIDAKNRTGLLRARVASVRLRGVHGVILSV
jgi:hypothetical protein